ncbi:addiction module antitoxin RelB [Clostridia bacterium]|nr:addiction module antitoxin RelB [Clostridia bacterium]
MATTTITIRMDDQLKKQAEMLFDDMGMNMTTAFTVFAKAVVKQGKIPFEIAANVPNAETMAAIEDVESGIGLSKRFHSVKDLMEDLNA